MTEITKKERRRLILRAIGFCAATFLMMFALSYQSVGLFATVQNTVPIITMVVGYFLIGEKLKKVEIINNLVSFTGVVTIVIFSKSASTTKGQNDPSLRIGALFANLGSAII